ncbi:fimbria/pilus outer membrane usher protein [Persephonella sp.]
MYSNSQNNDYLRGYTDLTAFFNKSVFSTSFLFMHSDFDKRAVRTDTYLLIQDIDNAKKIKVGDIYTQNTQWNTSLRVGGISIATDFTMRPDLITYPLPEFSGESVLPSSIDIFSENAKVYSTDLKPGPFEIKDIPVLLPEGNLRVIIKDILGRERIVEIPYFTHKKLLKKGLKEYSFTTGFVRKDYLQKSFSYHNLVTTGFYKFGLYDRLSLEFGAFLEGYNKGNIGISPYFIIPKLGFFNPITAVSYDSELNKTGYLYGINYDKSFKYLNFSFKYKKNSEDFVQPGTVLGLPVEEFSVFSSLFIPKVGSLSFGYFDRKFIDKDDTKNINITYSKQFFKILSLSATYNKFIVRDKENEQYRLSLNMPLGQNHQGSLSIQNNKKDQSYAFQITRNVNPAGFGYGIRGTKANGNANLLTNLYYNSHYATGYLDLSYNSTSSDSSFGVRGGLKGSVIYMDREIFFRKYAGGGFALVRIDPPIEGVSILANNREMGTTDKDGIVFISTLSPYVPNEIRIDPTSLDLKTHIDKTIYTFVPLKKHGYLLKFKSKKVNSVRLKIAFPDGSYPQLGLRFDVDDKLNAGIIGYNGKAFIENITAGKHIVTVDYGYGVCSFELVINEEWLEKIVPYIGEYICVPQTGTMIVKENKENLIKPAKLVQNKKEEEKLKKFKKVSYKKPNPKDSNKIDKNINNNAKVNTNTYTIEVGKFDSKEIEKAVEEYEEFQKEVVKEGDIYKIYIGKFKTKEDAERFMRIFKLKGKIKVVKEK